MADIPKRLDNMFEDWMFKIGGNKFLYDSQKKDRGDSSDEVSEEDSDEEAVAAVIEEKGCLAEVEEFLIKHSDVNLENALAINRAIQKALNDVHDESEELRLELQQREKKLVTDHYSKMANKELWKKPTATVLGGTFFYKGSQYFRDANGRGCPYNNDYINRSKNGEMFPTDFDLCSRHMWSTRDEAILINALKQQAIAHIQYVENLRQISNKPTTIPEHLDLKMQNLTFLLGQVDDTFEVDWEEISMYDLQYRHSPSSCKAMFNLYLKPEIKRGEWSEEENQRLREAVLQCGAQDWQRIANIVGNRSEFQCLVQYQTRVVYSQPQCNKWTEEESRILKAKVEQYTTNGSINWSLVANCFPTRNKAHIMLRYAYVLDPKISRAPFTPSEDLAILQAVKEYGDNFACLPKNLLPNRSTLQLRQRYKLTLQHRDKVQSWSQEDDKKLLDFVNKHGQCSWLKCAENLGNHTRTSCRTRFLTIKKFLERNPNASLADIPRKARQPDNLLTPENFEFMKEQMQQNPSMSLKPIKRPKRKSKAPVSKPVRKKKLPRPQLQHVWSEADDIRLMQFVQEHGPSSWAPCAEALGNHSSTSCRTRFFTIKTFLHHNPDAKVADFPRKTVYSNRTKRKRQRSGSDDDSVAKHSRETSEAASSFVNETSVSSNSISQYCKLSVRSEIEINSLKAIDWEQEIPQPEKIQNLYRSCDQVVSDSSSPFNEMGENTETASNAEQELLTKQLMSLSESESATSLKKKYFEEFVKYACKYQLSMESHALFLIFVLHLCRAPMHIDRPLKIYVLPKTLDQHYGQNFSRITLRSQACILKAAELYRDRCFPPSYATQLAAGALKRFSDETTEQWLGANVKCTDKQKNALQQCLCLLFHIPFALSKISLKEHVEIREIRMEKIKALQNIFKDLSMSTNSSDFKKGYVGENVSNAIVEEHLNETCDSDATETFDAASIEERSDTSERT